MNLAGFVEISQANGPGVYALAYKGEVVYVGQSRWVIRRIYEHKLAYDRQRAGKKPYGYSTAKGILFDSIHVRACLITQLDATEQAMIELYKPRKNIRHMNQEKIQSAIALNIGGISLTLNATPKPRPRLIERRI